MPADQQPFRRVMVVGNSGAGKTAFGARLASTLELPFVDLDDEHWGEGWTEPPRDAWRARVEALVQPPDWLLAGNFGSTIDVRADAADLVVLMSLPPALCVWRLLLRSVKTRLGRQVWRLPRDCRAGPDWEPMRDYPAFLLYSARWRTAARNLAWSPTCAAPASSASSTCARAPMCGGSTSSSMPPPTGRPCWGRG
jgi:hypothetical protein